MHKGTAILKWSTILGIVVLLNLFYGVGVSLFYPEPEFDQFCKVSETREFIETEDQCLAVGGQWNEQPMKIDSDIQGYCNEFYTCQMEYEAAQNDYDRTVFSILIVLGVIPLIVAPLLSGFSALSAGLSYGGILAVIIAGIRYWPSAPDTAKFILVGAALVAVLILAAKKFRD